MVYGVLIVGDKFILEFLKVGGNNYKLYETTYNEDAIIYSF